MTPEILSSICLFTKHKSKHTLNLEGRFESHIYFFFFSLEDIQEQFSRNPQKNMLF